MPSTLSLLLTLAPLALAQVTTSAKRGLVYVAPKDASDDDYWDSSTSDLTWYYNYGASPTSAFENTKLQFVPMLWGAPSDPSTDMSFYNTVKGLIEGGTNVTWVLGFNEPDGCDSGGSCVSAEDAATVWKKQFEPLKAEYGVQLGAPAVTGATTGFQWLQNFFTQCSAISSNGSSCVVDFIPIHWYGNFEGLASHMGEVNGTYAKNVSALWITEYADANADLSDAQEFYNESSQYFDRLDYVTHYSYFGAFRSSVSNVGADVAMLDQKGRLTDIGAWYLGQDATGNVPKGSASLTKASAWVAALAMLAAWGLS